MKSSRRQTDEFLQDQMVAYNRVRGLEEKRLDATVEVVASCVMIIVIGSVLFLGYFWQEHKNDATDSGIGCVEDCLEMEDKKP